eukprot:GILI01016712.1.p1 GENE.GILI01016712.1~~GILI01016712.1.p1  ORF type:complete len:316 (+),score=8.97 GILI01016712.1:53-1000(+)
MTINVPLLFTWTVFQISMTNVLIRYSNAASYPPALAALFVESVKVILCLVSVIFFEPKQSVSLQFRRHHVPLIMVSSLYFLQNSLLFVSLFVLPPALFQLFSQMKVASIAIFSSIFLGRRYSRTQILALVAMCSGVCVVQFQCESDNTSTTNNVLYGFFLVLIGSVTSGVAGVLNEKLLKDFPAISVFRFNLFLSFYSILIGLVSLSFEPLSDFSLDMLNSSSLSAICLHAVGGLSAAATVKYTSALVKSFAQCFSLILTSVLSMLVFSLYPTILFVCGSLVVISTSIIFTENAVASQPALPSPATDSSKVASSV